MIPSVDGRNRIKQGDQAEQAAADYLEQHGLTLLERNYRCRSGEIDLIMRDNAYLVFIEVRYRQHTGYGGAAASVDRRKQQKLLLAAQYWLQQRQAGNRPCRFDVVAVMPGKGGSLTYDWIKNAFELD